mgnify:CR=1 FL=1
MIERMDSRTPISSKWPSILFAHLYVVFFFRLVPHAVVRAADAVQPFLSRQFPGVLLLFGRQRGIVLGGFLFLVLFIHKPIL